MLVQKDVGGEIRSPTYFHTFELKQPLNNIYSILVVIVQRATTWMSSLQVSCRYNKASSSRFLLHNSNCCLYRARLIRIVEVSNVLAFEIRHMPLRTISCFLADKASQWPTCLPRSRIYSDIPAISIISNQRLPFALKQDVHMAVSLISYHDYAMNVARFSR